MSLRFWEKNPLPKEHKERVLRQKKKRFEKSGAMIEAIYCHIHYYNHQRSHTALKVPPVTYAMKIGSDTLLHNLGT